VDLKDLSDGELLDLAVPSDSTRNSRRILVMWLYLKEKPPVGLDDFDRLITEAANKELRERSHRDGSQS